MKNHGAFSGTNKGGQVYHSWKAMKSRCLCKTNPVFRHYGGRGIKVCDEWLHDFPVFRDYMGKPPTSKHTLERINNDGNYEPSNVRWATRKEQANNTRKNRKYVFKGNSRSVAQIADLVKLHPSYVRAHLISGEKPEDLRKNFRPHRRWHQDGLVPIYTTQQNL